MDCGSFESYDFDLAPSTYSSPPLPSDWDTYLTPPLGSTLYGNDWDLLQDSQNPDFNIWPWSPLVNGAPLFPWDDPAFNDFDKDAQVTYEFCLILGTECPVCIQVTAAGPSSESSR